MIAACFAHSLLAALLHCATPIVEGLRRFARQRDTHAPRHIPEENRTFNAFCQTNADMRELPIASPLAAAHAERMSTLTKTHLQALVTHLQQREAQLLQELADAKNEEVQNALASEDLPREPDANQTRDTSDREVRHAELLRDQQELKDVRAALQRASDGSYGECIDCGKNIAVARLQAFPSAKRCIQCQTLREDKKRRA